jgi:hypothetical protein
LGEENSYPLGDKADHNQDGSPATIDPIYQLPLESDSEGGWEVFMVGQGEQPAKKTTEETVRQGEEEIAWPAQLAKVAD